MTFQMNPIFYKFKIIILLSIIICLLTFNIETLSQEITKLGATGAIIDNDNPFRSFSNDLIIASGYYDIIKKQQIPVHNINKADKIKFKVDRTEFHLPKILFEEKAKLINIATLKHDLISGVSLGQKNLLGLIDKEDLGGQDLEEVISKVNKVIKPEFTILDGSRACLSANPLLCEPNDGNFLIMSDDSVCADSWATKILHYPVAKVRHLNLSENMRNGSQNCIEAKKSKNPILVANSHWKHLAPTPTSVEKFSKAYHIIRDTIGTTKADSLWAETLIPLFNKVKKTA